MCRSRWIGRVALVAAVATLAVSCSKAPDSHAEDDAHVLPPPAGAAPAPAGGAAAPTAGSRAAFRAFGSIGQASVVGAHRGDRLLLVDSADRVVARGRADELGSLVFYGVRPGRGYTVRRTTARATTASGAFRVLSRNDRPDPATYRRQSIRPGLNYVRMRDGVELAMTLRLPPGKTLADGPFPTVVEYSGYPIAAPHDLLASIAGQLLDPSQLPDPLAPSTATAVGSIIAPLIGFATVSVQLRGSGCSGGAFDLFGLPSIYDGYDTIETVAAQPWVKGGKVGMVGISFSGFSQLFVAGTRPPHLAAIAPMSVTDDLYTGIGFPGGIFNTGFAKSWLTERTEDAKPAPHGGQLWANVLVDQGDRHCIANQALHGQAQDALSLLSHLEFREPRLFADRTPGEWAKRIDVPTFLVGGLQDEQLESHWMELIPNLDHDPDVWITMYNGNHNDALQPAVLTRWIEFIKLFVADEVPSVPAEIRAFSGPLYDQVDGVPAPPLPQTRFSTMRSAAAARAEFRKDPRVRILLDVGAGSLGPGALQPTWELTSPTWPLRGTTAARYALAQGGHLVPELRTGAADTTGSDSYVADPSARPATDQSSDSGEEPNFHDEPNDWTPVADGHGLGWTSDVLDHDVLIAGASSLDVQVSATARDTDLQATISEVRPDGREMYVQTGWLRASHRKLDRRRSTATDPHPTHLARDAEPLSRDRPSLARVPIFPVVHVFRKGSRIRVTLQAPGGDRPLWTFRTIDHGSTRVTITHDAAHPSALVLPVVPGRVAGAPRPPCGVLRGQPCRDSVAASNGG
jgi:predicted acyl esterase